MPVSRQHLITDGTPRGSAGRLRPWRMALLAGISLAIGMGGWSAATAGEYLLGPQDKVRLKIYEWRASRDVIFEWTALNDMFTVGADGTLSLPFVGNIRAAGVTPSELGRSIGETLMQHMGLGRAPDASVEVIQFRPFYIVGHVMQPGEFPFRPGLTVLQALSIAGGLRTREESFSRLEREVIAGRGEVSLLGLDNVSLIARKARLEAELADAENITFPSQLTDRQGDGSIALLMDQERLIFKARRDAQSTQVRALTGLRDFLEKELSSLETQLSFYDKQIELVQRELTGVSSLVNKGLAVAPRELSLERTVTQIQSDRLSAETSLLRARQEISRTDISILELRNQRTNEVTTSLRETQGSLDALSRKADTAVQLLYESEISAPRLLAQRDRAARAQPIYTIVRPTEKGIVELTAQESDSLEPGDTIKVEIPLPAGLDDLAGPETDPALSGAVKLPPRTVEREEAMVPKEGIGIQ